MTAVVDSADGLTPEWITSALSGAVVTDVSTERIGTGQIGISYRLHLTYAGEPGPATLVAKLAGGDPASRQLVKDAFAKEVGFYRHLAATVDVQTPRCWYSAITDDLTAFTLLLDDLAPARPGVQAEGCSLAQAAGAIDNLARLHAPRWDDESLLELSFLTPTNPDVAQFLGELVVGATDAFVARFADVLSDRDAETLADAARAMVPWQLARPRPFAVVHGDYRLDNLMFAPDGDGVTALDWQTVSVGPPLRDVAYFLGTSLESELRPWAEEPLVTAYHDAIVGRGVTGYALDDCWADYRLGHLQGPLITMLGWRYATAEPTEGSDAMFLAMATRSCAAIRDLESIELL